MIEKYARHFRVVSKHKAVVFKECKLCGIAWQGVTHDLSKFAPTEFIASARHFQGDRSPIEDEKEKNGYSEAWLHHKGHNKHHWEYWTDFSADGRVVAVKIPTKYVIEMVCDWIGAGQVYSGKEWDQSEPLNYFNRVRSGRHFHAETEDLLVKLLNGINDYGLDWFHSLCKQRYPIFTDYEGLFIP